MDCCQEKPEAQLTPADLKVPAIGARDECYKQHDMCIWRDPCHIKICDNALASCLRTVSPLDLDSWITSEGYPLDAYRESILFDTVIPDKIHDQLIKYIILLTK
jgi:hypothetical protein